MPKLSEVAEINPGVDRSTIKDLSEAVSFVPMASVSEVQGAITSEEERVVSDVLKGFTAFQDRDVLVAKITPCFENGKIAHARIGKRLGFGSTEFHVIRPSAGMLDDRYLFHFLRQPSVREEGERRMTGSAGQKRVPKAFLESLDIPVPPLAEQRRIAAILDKADALRAKRREAIAKLDQLLQSVFLDMFGTLDSSRYPKVSLGEVCTRITDGAHFTPTYSDEGVPFLRVTDIQSKDINWQDVKRIPQSEHDELVKRCCPERGDVLYSKNGTIGIPKLVTWDKPFSIFVSLALLKPDHAKLRSEYLESFLSTPLALKQAIGHSKTGTVTNLHLVEIRKAQIPLPDLGAQDSWIELRRRFEIHRERLVSAAGLLEKLMSSVRQKAFAGTL